MEDIQSQIKEKAKSIGVCMAEHKALDVVVLDMRNIGFWTDFFVIGTASSSTHADSLLRAVKDAADGLGFDPLQHSGAKVRSTAGDGGAGTSNDTGSWEVVDLGPIVVHVMDKKARDFYGLEKLWLQAEKTEIKI
jgi:ribosome-associated protein